uniref:Sec23/Sec24 trunk domain-containing protein n=1 Tax=Anopheles melas TaxID=34690 RepID=A0A182UHM5_9DIPT
MSGLDAERGQYAQQQLLVSVHIAQAARQDSLQPIDQLQLDRSLRNLVTAQQVVRNEPTANAHKLFPVLIVRIDVVIEQREKPFIGTELFDNVSRLVVRVADVAQGAANLRRQLEGGAIGCVAAALRCRALQQLCQPSDDVFFGKLGSLMFGFGHLGNATGHLYLHARIGQLQQLQQIVLNIRFVSASDSCFSNAKPFTAAGAAVAGGPSAAAAAFPIPSQGSAVPTQLRTNIVQNWATTNGNSTTSSRTSSPAFGSNGMPTAAVAAPRTAPALAPEPVRPYPTTNGNNNHNNNNLPSMASSQIQPPPPAAPQTLPSGQATASGYNLSPNNNWSSAKMAQQPGAANLINTPPKSASGMSTPLNASTPTLTGPTILGGQQQSVQKLTASVQDLSLQRPPTMGVAAQAAGAGAATTQAPNPQLQQAPPTVNGGGPPVASTATTNGTMGAAAMFASHPAGATARGYGQAPPPSSAQYQQMQQQSQPPLKHTQQSQQQTAPSSMLQGPMPNGPGSTTNPSLQAAAAGMGKFNAPPPTGAGLGSNMPTALGAGQTPLNKRPILWGTNAVDLLQNRHVLPTDRVTPPSIHLVNPLQSSANCNPDIFRCTLNKIPESSSLLQKSRLPLGLLIHPFRDLNLRPPQPAIYLFLLDVSSLAQQSGYLYTVCNTLMEHLDSLPGDARTQVGFIAYNSAIHFYNISEEYNQPHEVTVLDVEDVFLPYPDNLLVNLKSCKELVKDLLKQLPKRFEHTHDTHSALGAALQVAYKLMSASGGRVTVFQTCLPNYGPGALQSRENPNNRSSKEVAHLGPATDFYKRLALECSAGISKFSGGCMHHIPLYSESKPQLVKTLRKSLERYLTRKIGFEAVMRITYEESLTKIKTVCFQAALLYTSSKAERRIRVHTLCIPVTESLSEVMYSADPQCIVGLLSKMAVDRSVTSSLSDARDAFINATVDIISAFRLVQNLAQTSSKLMVPENLRLLPLYILAMLKHPAFRTGTSTRLDDRVFAMSEMKSLPLDQLMRYIYPDFYLLDCLFVSGNGGYVDDGHKLEPPRLHLSAEK